MQTSTLQSQKLNPISIVQLDKPQTKAQIKVDSSHQPIKKLISFVSLFPNHTKAVFFLFANETSVPKQLFSMYPSNTNDFQDQGIHYIETFINEEKHLFIGLDHSFFDLAHDSDNQSLTVKHLIFVYLIKKLESIKFVLCFDKDAIKESALLTVKNFFNRLATSFDFENQNNYGKAFMILISHSNQNDSEEIETICQGKFKRSVSQPQFFKENHDFAKQIILSIFKAPGRHQKRFVRFLTKFDENQFESRKAFFERVIQITQPLENNKIFDINKKFLALMSQKSIGWKSFSVGKEEKNQGQLKSFFKLWEKTFQGMTKFISQKMTKQKNVFSDFENKEGFLPDRISKKFELKLNLAKNREERKNGNKAQQTCEFVSLLMDFMLENSKEYEKIKLVLPGGSQENSKPVPPNFSQQQLRKFMKLLYSSQVLNSESLEKVLYDFFMVMDELVSAFDKIKDPNSDTHFFENNDLITTSLSNNKSIRKLLYNSVKILNHILNIEFARIEKSQFVDLECLEPHFKAIKEKMDQQKKVVSDLKFLENESLRKTIARYERELNIKKATKLSSKPLTRIAYTVKYIRKETDIIENKPLLDMFAKSCLHYIKQYKSENTPLQIKLKIVSLLEYDMTVNFREIANIYQNEIDAIMEKVRKHSRQFNDDEKDFALKYTEFVIGTGMIQKLKEKAHEISTFDKGLSKKMLCRALMRDCAKTQLEFMKSDFRLKRIPVSAEDEQMRKAELENALDAIEKLQRYFRRDIFSEETKLKIENELLDI